jgi:hypothetical protein
MIRLSGPRCLAMSVIGALFGWWSNSSSIADKSRYSGMTPDALITELASKNDGVLSTSIMGGLRIEPTASRDRDSSTPQTAACGWGAQKADRWLRSLGLRPGAE